MSFVKKVVVKSKQWFNGWVLRNPDDLLALEYIRENRKHDFRHRYDIFPGDIVFDLGGHKGEWCRKISSMYPECVIHSFELLSVYSEGLAEQFKNSDKIFVNNFGLSASDGEIDITYDGLSSSGIDLKPDSKSYVGKLKSFEDYVVSKSISKIKLLKMNIEGGEYDLLESLVGTPRIVQIENIQIQFHNYGPEFVKRKDKIRSELSKTHYLTYDYAWTFENWRLKTVQ
jgi:FkbM family methyltransferase